MRRTWFVYLLRCGDGTFYTGVTTDLARRISEHASGRGARYTRGRGTLRLHYWEGASTRGGALRREHALRILGHDEKEALPRVPWIRPAAPGDLPFLARWVAALGLDPERLSHEQFAVAAMGRLRTGFARIKPYAGFFELADVGVLPRYRGHGTGGRLVRLLVKRFPTRQVWITTRIPAFFERLGFHGAKGPGGLREKLARVCARNPEGGAVVMSAERPPRPGEGRP